MWTWEDAYGEKSEYRNPLFDSKLAESEQSETNSNVQNSKYKPVLNLGHLNFGIVSSFVLRISNLIKNAGTCSYFWPWGLRLLTNGCLKTVILSPALREGRGGRIF